MRCTKRANSRLDASSWARWDEMKATLELNAPNYARAMLSTEELIAAIQKIKD
jgi:hypothetical protein